MQSHQTRVRVRYAETDQMGVVYYANYLVWMEVARVELCKALGFRYRDMELEDGVMLAVIEAQCRYLHPARFDEEVILETRIAEANSRVVEFAYEMRLADGGPADAEHRGELAFGQAGSDVWQHVVEGRRGDRASRRRPFFAA